MTAPGSDLWVLVRQKALEQTQKVSPQAKRVSLMVALSLTTSDTLARSVLYGFSPQLWPVICEEGSTEVRS